MALQRVRLRTVPHLPPRCFLLLPRLLQAESGGMVLVAYAGPVRPAAALRNSVLCLPTDTHFVPDAEGLLLQEGSSAGTDSHKFSF